MKSSNLAVDLLNSRPRPRPNSRTANSRPRQNLDIPGPGPGQILPPVVYCKQIRRTAKKLLLQNGKVNLNNLYKIGIKALNLAWAQVQVVILCIFIKDVIIFYNFTVLCIELLNYGNSRIKFQRNYINDALSWKRTSFKIKNQFKPLIIIINSDYELNIRFKYYIVILPSTYKIYLNKSN